MTTINTNIGAIAAQANMTKVNNDFNTAMTRLSSGLRINGAKDDAAGMAIAEKMTSQVMGINQAIRNAADGKNLLDTTESAHVEVSNMLQRVRELAVQSANDTNTGSDRGNITAEARQLIAEINRVAENTTFNGMKVMDGSFQGKQFQIGADAGQTLSISIDSTAATAIGAFQARSNVGIGDPALRANQSIAISGFAGSTNFEAAATWSAAQLASRVNADSAKTGVEATATTRATLSGLTEAGRISFSVNNQSIGEVAIADVNDLRSLRDAINAQTTRTGVTATMGETNASIVLSNSTGENISISNYSASNSGVDLEDDDNDPDTPMVPSAVQGEPNLTVTALRGDGVAAGTVTLDSDDTDPDPAITTAVTSATIVGEVTFTSTQTFSINSSNVDDGDATNGVEIGFFNDRTVRGSLSSVADIDLSTAENAAKAIGVIDVALQKISQARGNLGAQSNRLDSTISNLTNISVSVQTARSQVTDADFAKESTNLARGQILSQAATAMLAQANSSKQNVLSLLRG